MNILFLTIGRLEKIEDHTLYCDLLRAFIKEGHNIYTISPYERRTGKRTEYIINENVHMLHVSTGNIVKCSIIEKGITTLSIESIYIRGIKKYFSNVKFDLVIYSTPPITFYKAIKYVKKRDNAKSYLLLKDIFPQNAIDIGMLNKSGIKGIIYRYFRHKEKSLYGISDYIGCMSQANVDYILKHNPEIDRERVEICPNSIEVQDMSLSNSGRNKIRMKYGIPLDKIVFVYGGNLGKPQGIPFLIECLKSQMNNEKVFFLIIGDGTEFNRLSSFFNENTPNNMKLMQRLPKDEYDQMIAACDVGMIFLNHRFTIPNFPSRLLTYMQAKLPVLAATDPNTDVGKVIVEGKFGWWCESKAVEGFETCIRKVEKSNLKVMGDNSFQYLNQNYTVADSFDIIVKRIS